MGNVNSNVFYIDGGHPAPQSRKPYQYKYNYREWQDELDLNVTAMDFRQYDNALGRFLNPDRLSELAPGITPYRFAFNNPNYWSDPTGLFESQAAALAYMNENNLTGTVYQGEDGLYHLTTSVFDYVMSNGELVISAYGGGIEITIGGTGGSSGGGSGGGFSGGFGGGFLGGFGFGGNGGFFGFSASEVGAIATSGGLFAAALQDRATINQNYEYNYGTKTQSADDLTKLNRARMETIENRAKKMGRRLGFVAAGASVYEAIEDPSTANIIKATVNIGLLFIRMNPAANIVLTILDLSGGSDWIYNQIGGALDN